LLQRVVMTQDDVLAPGLDSFLCRILAEYSGSLSPLRRYRSTSSAMMG
jgi:hypothetical protein